MSFELATDRPPVKPADIPLRIYSNPICPFAQGTRAILAAAYTGVKHEVVFVHLTKPPQWWLDEINPFGRKVPVIEHDGHLIRESLVTFDYIDEVFGNSKLWPTDPYKKAQSKLILNDFTEILFPNYFKYYFGTNDETTAPNMLKYFKSVEEVIDQYGGPFVMGDTVSAIDLLMWPWFERLPAISDAFSADDLKGVVTEANLPLIVRWIKAMKEVDAVKKSSYIVEQYTQYYKRLQENRELPDYSGFNRKIYTKA